MTTILAGLGPTTPLRGSLAQPLFGEGEPALILYGEGQYHAFRPDGTALGSVQAPSTGALSMLDDQGGAGLAASRDDDWIWQAVTEHPDLIGGFNRLDSTILKSCAGKVLAKEGADGLLGLSIIHPNYPQGLGVVVKVAHGWNPQATWYVARSILGVLGFQLRNPYPLHRQKAFIVPGVVPDKYQSALEEIPTWDRWDPDQDRFYYDWRRFLEAPVQKAETEEEKR